MLRNRFKVWKGIYCVKKSLRSPIIWFLVLSCVVIVILYFCGFRITYAPKLENSWNAISACAGWFSVIMSAIAIFVAINIPKKIAEQQNKISLFEKRYNALNTFLFLISVVKTIFDGNVKDKNYRFYLDNMIETYNAVSNVRELISDCKEPHSIYVRLVFEAGKIQYLFDLKEMEIVAEFLITLDEYISDIYKCKSVDETKLRNLYNELLREEIQEKLEAQIRI